MYRENEFSCARCGQSVEVDQADVTENGLLCQQCALAERLRPSSAAGFPHGAGAFIVAAYALMVLLTLCGVFLLLLFTPIHGEGNTSLPFLGILVAMITETVVFFRLRERVINVKQAGLSAALLVVGICCLSIAPQAGVGFAIGGIVAVGVPLLSRPRRLRSNPPPSA